MMISQLSFLNGNELFHHIIFSHLPYLLLPAHTHTHTHLQIQNVGKLVAVIGDEDTVTGFLLAGIGHRTADSCNFLTVKADTSTSVIESTLKSFTTRDDIGIILINQHVANDMRHFLKDYNQTIPTILEIPSKEHPYDPEQDFIMQRVNMFLGKQRYIVHAHL